MMKRAGASRAINRTKNVKSAPLKSLEDSYNFGDGFHILSIEGELSFKAIFPESYETGNSKKAALIVDAVESAKRPKS